MLECPLDTFEYIPLFVRLRTSIKKLPHLGAPPRADCRKTFRLVSIRPRGARLFQKKIGLFGIIAIFAVEINIKTIMARYIYKSTRNYNIGFEWVSTSFDLDYVHFRFTIETYRGINRSAWMTAKQAMKYISYGGLLYGYADSLRIIKRIKISD